MAHAPSHIAIRDADAADTPAVIDLWQRCGLTRAWNDPYRDIERAAAEPTTRVLVATRDDAIIGTAMVGYDGHRGWLYYLGIDPAHRGQGHGATLIEAARAHLRALGCPKLMFMVRRGQPELEAYYARLGFEPAEVNVLSERLINDDASPSPPIR